MTGWLTDRRTEPRQCYYIPSATRCAVIIKKRFGDRFDRSMTLGKLLDNNPPLFCFFSYTIWTLSSKLYSQMFIFSGNDYSGGKVAILMTSIGVQQGHAILTRIFEIYIIHIKLPWSIGIFTSSDSQSHPPVTRYQSNIIDTRDWCKWRLYISSGAMFYNIIPDFFIFVSYIFQIFKMTNSP